MKKFLQIPIGVVLLSLNAFAASPAPLDVFAVTSTNKDTTLSYAVVSPRGTTDGTAPVVNFINAGSDLATAKISTYKVLATAAVSATNSTTTIYVQSTNTASGGVGVNWQSGTILIRHQVDDSFEKRTLTANSATTNIIVTAAPYATLPGDKVYYVSTTGAPSIFWGVGTNSLSGSGSPLLVGEKSLPLLLEINATTAGAINVVSGVRSR